jgi:AcrR family transcriptional regulator
VIGKVDFMSRVANSLRVKPIQTRARRLQEAVLEAALACYEKVGFDISTTNLIAQKAGVSIGSLYRYFPDKDGLLRSVLKKYTEDNREYFVQSLTQLQQHALPEVIEQMISLSIDHFLKRSRFFTILMTKMMETANRDLVFEARQTLALQFAEILWETFPEIQGKKNDREVLIADLRQGFHGYMASLFSMLIEGVDKSSRARLQENMTKFFKAILIS